MNIKQKILLVFISILLIGINDCLSNNDPKEKAILFRGKIIDFNRNELLAGVTITTSAEEKTFYSDLSGNFFIYVKVQDNENFKLEFSQIGYVTKTLKLIDFKSDTNNLEINLTEE